MAKIWQKSNTSVHPVLERYNTGTDYVFDRILLPYDVSASREHARMLVKIGVLTDTEFQSIDGALDELLQRFEAGEIEIRVEDEDCHTVIEAFLTKKIGEAGKKIHTGRSRNDQVLTAVRLYTLDQLSNLSANVAKLAETFLVFAKEHETTVLPGYTHTQQAMPSSVAHWALSFVESLLCDLEAITAARRISDRNPLGTAAGFGVTFPLDREMTRKNLGFEKNLVNSLFAQASRGKFESLILESLCQVMMTLSRFASDLLFFTSRELAFFHVDSGLTTGSSIMPQKKNLDSMELLRANASTVIANQLIMKDTVKSLLSGYNRDLQLLKKPLIESFGIVSDSVSVAWIHVENMETDAEAIVRAIKPDILAADVANALVEKEGIPFREAYVRVGESLDSIQPSDLLENIRSKRSLWSPGNLAFEYYEKALAEFQKNGF